MTEIKNKPVERIKKLKIPLDKKAVFCYYIRALEAQGKKKAKRKEICKKMKNSS